ncbi:MAG: TlpA family protein disulfide reductase [Actinomycetota bacterium]|nr:TlpA family protein disulfide reductase [Actinomycetota bacterium]
MAVLVAAAVISAVGAVVWSRTVAVRNEDRFDVRLDEPGEYVDPAAQANPPFEGSRLPAVELLDVAGTSAALSGDARPMVVNIWYSTCPPCARELADFAAVESALGDDVRFVGVNPFDGVEAMQRFAAERGVDYELLRDPDFEFTDALGVVAFPATLFVDPDGTIVGQDGVLDEAELRHHIQMHWGVGA